MYEWEVFESYTGTIWIRREMTEEELREEGFEEPGWHQESFKNLEEAYERIGVLTNKQLSLF